MQSPATISQLLETRRVVLCVGCGGVGKTTVTAALGLAAARSGKRVLTLTIDPARRLAQSLGLASMTTEEQEVPAEVLRSLGAPPSARLSVMMLDTKRTFDELVTRFASSPAARDRILQNRLYRHLSTSLAGTADYMAMEKLLAVKEDPRFDLVILDTPPTRNALDFLEAPERLVEALDGAAVRWFVQAFDRQRRFSLNLVAQGVAAVLRGVGKLTGGGFLEQMAELVSDLDDLFGGFRERAGRVSAALRGPDVAYVLVTSPAPLAVEEIGYFAERLHQGGMKTDAFVVNRLHPRPPEPPDAATVERALARHGVLLGPGGTDRALRAVADDAALAARDAVSVARLHEVRARLGASDVPLVRLEALPSDVHDALTLASLAHELCPGAP